MLLVALLVYAVFHISDAATLEANGKRGRVVILGDSITSGYGITLDKAYPALLQAKIDEIPLSFDVVNAGVSGDTTASGLRRIDWIMGPGADVLIIALGGNDGLRGVSPAQTRQNLEGIIEKARKKSPQISVILAGMEMPANMGADYVRVFADVFPKVATEKQARLVPFLLKNVGGVIELNQQDLIHPTAEGQKLIAENIWPTLLEVIQVKP